MKPHAPVPYDKTIAHAIKAMREGNASASQQKRGMEWIELVVCDVEGMSYHDQSEGGERASSFHEGRRFAGNQIRKMSNPITLAALEAKATTAPKRGKTE